MNFIKQHLIISIYRLTGLIYQILREENNTFIYFETPISFDGKLYDRIRDGLLFEFEKIIPNKISLLNGRLLVCVFKELNKKNVYLYKDIEGKFYKLKPKTR